MTRTLLLAFALALMLLFLSALAQPGEQEDPVGLAISKCRARLQDATPEAPYAFPKTRYRLAILLESRLPKWLRDDDEEGVIRNEESDDINALLAQAYEIVILYEASALNETHGFPPTVRVEALTKSAALSLRLGQSGEANGASMGKFDAKSRAEDMLFAAVNIRAEVDGQEVEEDPSSLSTAHAAAFEALVQLLLTRASEVAFAPNGPSGHGGSNDDNNSHMTDKQYLTTALELCNLCSELSPDEPVVDEYRGAVLRRLHGTRSGSKSMPFAPSPILLSGAGNDHNAQSLSAAAEEVAASYDTAARKSHEAAIVATLTSEARPMSRYPCGKLRYKFGKLPPSNQLTAGSTEIDSIEAALLSQLWTRLVRHIVLAAASAREAGLADAEDKNLSYGLTIVSHPTLSKLVAADMQADLLTNAGIRHKVRGETKEAAQLFRKASEINPGDGHALVQLASLDDGDDTASVMELSDSYVAGLFDGYSARFERELVDDLGYRGHEIVAEAIVRHWGSNGEQASADKNGDAGEDDEEKVVLLADIGCGTGLLGSLLREKLDRGTSGQQSCVSSNVGKVIIQGVDLSPRMVELSRSRKWSDAAGQQLPVYDAVSVLDASEFLRSVAEGSVDAITASDVFIYIGALEELFQECRRVLKPGGLVSFTVEAFPESRESGGKDEVRLMKSGRFGHSRKYLEKVARDCGMVMIEWKDEILRKQAGEDVAGAVVTLRG